MPNENKREDDNASDNADKNVNASDLNNDTSTPSFNQVNTGNNIKTDEALNEEAIKRSFEPLESRTAKSSSENNGSEEDKLD